MFNSLQLLRSQLSSSIGNRFNSSPDDIKKTRRNFASLGRYDGDTQLEYIDQKLDNTIRTFQYDKGLKQDGIMNPKGETEAALNRDLSGCKNINLSPLRLSGNVGNMQSNRSNDVTQVQQSLSRLKLLPESKLYNPSGIIDRETDLAIKVFQEKNDLRIDGKLFPNGETQNKLNAILLSEDSGDDSETPEAPAPDNEEPPPAEPPKDNDPDEPPIPPRKPEPPKNDDPDNGDGDKEPDKEPPQDNDPKDNEYCTSVYQSLRDVQKEMVNLAGDRSEVESEIADKEQEIENLNKDISNIGILDLIDPRKSKGIFGGPGVAAEIVITGRKVQKKAEIEKQISRLETEISQLENKIKWLDTQLAEAHKEQNDLAEELSLNCPDFNE